MNCENCNEHSGIKVGLDDLKQDVKEVKTEIHNNKEWMILKVDKVDAKLEVITRDFNQKLEEGLSLLKNNLNQKIEKGLADINTAIKQKEEKAVSTRTVILTSLISPVVVGVMLVLAEKYL